MTLLLIAPPHNQTSRLVFWGELCFYTSWDGEKIAVVAENFTTNLYVDKQIQIFFWGGGGEIFV